MSDDLISREDTKQAIRHKFKTLAVRCEINEVLNSMPSVQPKEKTGKWEEVYGTNESPLFQRKYYCSCCREWNAYGKTAYCMNCGAKMEG